MSNFFAIAKVIGKIKITVVTLSKSALTAAVKIDNIKRTFTG